MGHQYLDRYKALMHVANEIEEELAQATEAKEAFSQYEKTTPAINQNNPTQSAKAGAHPLHSSHSPCKNLMRKNPLPLILRTESHHTNRITDVQSLQFDLRTIQAATNNFSYENKIGEGGFGMVYKGTLANGQEIVVKRLSKGSDKAQKNLRMRSVPIASVVKCIIEWGHSSKRAHVNWNYVFWAIVFPRLAEQVQCATTYPNGESPGGSWATNGHHPTRVSPGVVSLGCCGNLYGHSPR
ncbi:hypothetical protein LguiB_026912 [Lonicera macranthoides]